MKKILIPILFLMGIGMSTFADDKSKKELKGDKFYFVYSFDKAINSYTNSKDLSTEGKRRLAESYRNLNKNTESEEAYADLTSVQTDLLPVDYYNYAMVLRANGKNDQANIWMDKFSTLKPNDLRAMDYVANKNNMTSLLKDDGQYKITPLSVNTNADDFGPAYYKDAIVFSSSRANPKMVVKKFNWTGKPFWSMYISKVEEGQFKKPEIFDKSLNGKMHDGPASFSNDGTFMAFTRNNYSDKSADKIVELQIFFSTNTEGKWSEAVPFAINNTAYSAGHPSLTEDGKTMYFASDMQGGLGGVDIYRIKKTDSGAWGVPENLGSKVNTEGDEMFPFYEENSGILLFSSNGRYGLGGLDVFVCEIEGAGYGRIYNAGFPLNTTYDDYAAILDKKAKKGYVSSNRIDGSGGDDIYAFDMLKGFELDKKVKGLAMDKDSRILPKTFVTLLDVNSETVDTMTTKEDGAYQFSVTADKNYKLSGVKENYNDASNTFDTKNEEQILESNLILTQKEELAKVEEPKKEEAPVTKKEEPVTKKEEPVVKKTEIKEAKEGDDLAKIAELNPIYFDYAKFHIRADAEKELDKIVKIMNDHPNMVVELRSYTDCRATKEYNQGLSDKRAAESAWFIKKRISKPERITSKGYGESNLVNKCPCTGEVVSDCSEDEHQLNRRTEFIIVSNKKTDTSSKTSSIE